jgi:hypothetical protein
MQKEDLNNLVTVADLTSFSEKIISEIHRLSEKEKPQFYTPTQFSKLTGMPYTTVVHYCKKNFLKARQEFKGGSWQIYSSEINRLKEEAQLNHLAYR